MRPSATPQIRPQIGRVVAAAMALIGGIGLTSAATAGESVAMSALATIQGHAVAVVDGDSITVDGVEWRLLGYDAPEIDRARCEGERRLGLVARRRLSQIIQAAAESATPAELVDSGRRDRYRRPLGDLLIGGANVRETMIAEDLGRAYNGGIKKGWCSRDSRDDLVPGPPPSREMARPPAATF